MQFYFHFDVLEGTYLQQKDTLKLHKKFFWICGGVRKTKSIVYSAQSSEENHFSIKTSYWKQFCVTVHFSVTVIFSAAKSLIV